MESPVTAGRELDALVARGVMGYRGKYDDEVPFYSDRIFAAWEVVERFQKLSDEPILISHSETNKLWRVQFRYNLSMAHREFPLAVCLAALKALGYIAFGDETGETLSQTKINLMPDLAALKAVEKG